MLCAICPLTILGDFYRIPEKSPKIVSGQIARSMRVKRSDPQKKKKELYIFQNFGFPRWMPPPKFKAAGMWACVSPPLLCPAAGLSCARVSSSVPATSPAASKPLLVVLSLLGHPQLPCLISVCAFGGHPEGPERHLDAARQKLPRDNFCRSLAAPLPSPRGQF